MSVHALKREKTPHETALHIVHEMQMIGFPSSNNVHRYKKAAKSLQDLAEHLSHSDQISIQNIENLVQKMQEKIKSREEIPARLYAFLTGTLFVLKESLQGVI